MNSVILDLGANKGQNLEYYLSRADRVIAVEGVPSFSEQIRSDFGAEIEQGRLVLLNVIVASKDFANRNLGITTIYESKNRPGESTLNDHMNQEGWIGHKVPVWSISRILESQLGKEDQIEFIKIDLEGSDKMVLDEILVAPEFLPRFMSVEIHDLKIVDSILTSKKFKSFRIEKAGFPAKAESNFRFSRISSGPFGYDIKGSWFNDEAIASMAKVHSPYARDIHVASVQMPNLRSRISRYFYLLKIKESLQIQIQRSWLQIATPILKRSTTLSFRNRVRILKNLGNFTKKKRRDKKIVQEFQNYTREI